MTPEGKVKAKVKKILGDYHIYSFWPVQTGYGTHTLDCLGCYKELFFAIETKAAGKKPTVRQYQVIDEILDAGGVVFVIDGTPGSYDGLKTWLEAGIKDDGN